MTTKNRSINLKDLRNQLDLEESQARVEKAWAEKDQKVIAHTPPICADCIWHGLHSDCSYERIDPDTDIQYGPDDNDPVCEGYTAIQDYVDWLDKK